MRSDRIRRSAWRRPYPEARALKPEIAGRPPIGSIYCDPFDGPDPVTIWLVFEVTDLDLPATMQVRDIVVR